MARSTSRVHMPGTIKREPGQQIPTTNGTAYSEYAGSSTNDAASVTMPADESFFGVRDGRSDAPPPSDRDTEPLLREVRPRQFPSNGNGNVNINDSPAATPEGHFGFHTSFQDIGEKLKACNDTLGELQGLGVSHDVPLPELILVGDQSAGKSSVMSGLAHLDLPRSEGTCTRCPLHIRASRNNDWSCRVSLSKEYTYDPPSDGVITQDDVTDDDPFFPWRKLPVTDMVEFKTVHDKTQIEDVLRWAQVAILNDDKAYELFVPGSGATALNSTIEEAETTAKFSPNVVFLEIKGPELPSLSFYDMPGLFQNPPDANDDYLVNVVRNLSEKYIRRSSAIILCSMPMNNDAENSFTFGLARKLGAIQRTIGVLTKADLLPEAGNHDQWLSIMTGQSHSTGLGYFITSRPQDKDLDELKRFEDAMFVDFTEKWPATFHAFSERCGVEKLKKFLSEKLGEQFQRCLPDIQQKIKGNLDKINRQLSTLPELPQNVELEIRQSLFNFTETARNRVSDFGKQFSPLPQEFRTCILEIKPKFVLKDKSDIPVFEISDGDSDETGSVLNTPSKRRMGPPTTPAAKRQRSETPATNGTTNGNASFVKPEASDNGSVAPSASPRASAPATRLQPPFQEYANIGRGFRTLAAVRVEIAQKMRAGTPGYIPVEVYESLVLEAMRPWSGPMMTFLNETVKLLGTELMFALNAAFEARGLKKRIIYQESRKYMREFLEAHRHKAVEDMKQIFSDETQQIITYNDDVFMTYKSSELLLLTRFRHKMRMEMKGLLPPKPLEDWEDMTEIRRKEDENKRVKELQKIGPDTFEREIEVIAYIRGYYRLAAHRFVDSIAQCIVCRMIPNMKRELSLYLDKKLGLVNTPDPAVYVRLMEEDTKVAEKREMLKKESAKFGKALASIDALRFTNGGSSGDTASVIFAAERDIAMPDVAYTEDV